MTTKTQFQIGDTVVLDCNVLMCGTILAVLIGADGKPLYSVDFGDGDVRAWFTRWELR